MIDFRYHLVSIIAIFFALAAGIVLGAGPLGERVDEDLPGQLSAMREENQTLRSDLESTQADLANQETFIEAVAPNLVGNVLEGERVAVVALPGAEAETVSAVQEELVQAGANADLVVRVEPAWTDPDSEAVLDSLASDLVSSGTELPEDGDGYLRGATVLSAALLTRPEGDTGAPTGDTVDSAALAAFQEAELIAVEGEASSAATLTVAVAGSVSGDDSDDRVGRLITLATQLDAQGTGTVVTGPAATAEAGALLGAIRANGDVAGEISTVDSVTLPSSQVALVFALAEQETGEVGHYGVVGETDGPLPELPEPAPDNTPVSGGAQ